MRGDALAAAAPTKTFASLRQWRRNVARTVRRGGAQLDRSRRGTHIPHNQHAPPTSGASARANARRAAGPSESRARQERAETGSTRVPGRRGGRAGQWGGRMVPCYACGGSEMSSGARAGDMLTARTVDRSLSVHTVVLDETDDVGRAANLVRTVRFMHRADLQKSVAARDG